MEGNFQVKNKAELEKFAVQNWGIINQFLARLSEGVPIPIYSSVDIRESRDKFAPVDHNLFPAGFNNLCALDLAKSTHLFSQFFKEHGLKTQQVGILPESNTKNLFYLDHLHFLSKALKDTGSEVVILSFDPELFGDSETIDLKSHSQFDIRIHRAHMVEQKILVCDGNKGKVALDLLILNHDQSVPLSVDWKEVKTPIMPSPFIGWFNREKARHFFHYEQVAQKFCQEFKINPNLIMAKFKSIDEVDFASKEGLDRIAQAVDEIKEGLPAEAKIFVKANKGTYGMGISVVNSGQEILQMNRKTRNKMDIGKNQIKFTSVLVQEGIDTILTYDHSPAEVVIYLVGHQPAGGFMRTNPLRDTQSNLNAKGMVFQKFCMSEISEHQEHKCKEAIYSIIARLSTIASGYEIREVQ